MDETRRENPTLLEKLRYIQHEASHLKRTYLYHLTPLLFYHKLSIRPTILNQSIMLFLKTTLLLCTIASVHSSPVPQGLGDLGHVSLNAVDEHYQIDVRMSSSVKIKDKTCLTYKRTYTAAQITEAVKRENNKTHPGKYGNSEAGGMRLFETTEQLYQVGLDGKSWS